MTQLSLAQLIETLETLPPLELNAVRLLHTLRPQTGEWFPSTLTPENKQQVVTATVELVEYTRTCAEMARRLSHLQAVPLRDVALAEFSL